MPAAPPLKGDRKVKVRDDTPAGATSTQRSGKSKESGGSRSRERGKESKEGSSKEGSSKEGSREGDGSRSRERNKASSAPPLPEPGRRPSPLRQVLEKDKSLASSQVTTPRTNVAFY
jgi:hypothetical protein